MRTLLRRSTPPAADAVRERDPHLDNVRFLAVILVVVGHAWEPLRDHRPVEAAHLVVYTFHLPVFVLVAGHLGRGFTYSRSKVVRAVTGLLIPYLIFDAAYQAFAGVAEGREFVWTPFQPYYLTWFLIALFSWRLSAPLWPRLVLRPRWAAPTTLPLALPLAVLVAAVAGAVPAWRPMPTELALDRVTALLPFFVAGLALRPERLAVLRRRAVRIAGAVVLAVAPVVAYLLAGRIDPEWAHWRRGYGQLGVPLPTGVALWAVVLVAAALLTAAFIAVVPARRLWFTRFGAATVYAYLLHGFVVHGASYAGWYAPMHGAAGPVVVTVLAVGLAFVLVTEPVRRATRWLVAPPLERLGDRARRLAR